MSDDPQDQSSTQNRLRAQIEALQQEIIRRNIFDKAHAEHKVAASEFDLSCSAIWARMRERDSCDYFLPYQPLPLLHEYLGRPGDHVRNAWMDVSQTLLIKESEWRTLVDIMDAELRRIAARNGGELSDIS